MGEFASALSDFPTPSTEAVWADSSTCWKVFDLLAVWLIVVFPVSCQGLPCITVVRGCFGTLDTIALALHPLVLDVIRTACHSQVSIQKNTLHDVPASVKQEFLMALLLFLALVDPGKAIEALMTALRK